MSNVLLRNHQIVLKIKMLSTKQQKKTAKKRRNKNRKKEKTQTKNCSRIKLIDIFFVLIYVFLVAQIIFNCSNKISTKKCLPINNFICFNQNFFSMFNILWKFAFESENLAVDRNRKNVLTIKHSTGIIFSTDLCVYVCLCV